MTVHLSAMRRFRALVFVFAALPAIARGNAFVQFDYNLTLEGRSRDTVIIELFDDRPLTRDNFLQYVNAGLYNGSLMHRLVPGFIIQGGGFYEWRLAEPEPLDVSLDPSYVVDLDGNPNTSNPQVNNEFGNSPPRSNVRGTLAMAKLAPPSEGGPPNGGPNSATNQYFFNLSNTNAANLDNQNGGFTVFAQVVGDGMALIDGFASMSRTNLNPDVDDNGTRDAGPFNEIPFIGNSLARVDVAKQIEY
jgi:peptidyl-prolyl cis-trans isomerase A (cyclophilin A)